MANGPRFIERIKHVLKAGPSASVLQIIHEPQEKPQKALHTVGIVTALTLAGIYGIGIAMMDTHLWAGSFLAILSIVVTVALYNNELRNVFAILKMPSPEQRPTLKREVISILLILVIEIALFGYLFRAKFVERYPSVPVTTSHEYQPSSGVNPITISASLNDAIYPNGYDLSGISWRPEFKELDIGIFNTTSVSYANLNFAIQPDKNVVGVVQSSSNQGKGTPACSITNATNFRFKEVNVDFRQGKMTEINGLSIVGTNRGYRIRCDTLLPGQDIRIVMAIADIRFAIQPKEAPSKEFSYIKEFGEKGYIQKRDDGSGGVIWIGHAGADIYNPSDSPERVLVKGSYTLGGQNIDDYYQMVTVTSDERFPLR